MFFKRFLLRLFDIFRIYEIAAFLKRNSLIVIAYHGVTRRHERDSVEDYQNNHVDAGNFRKQIEYISRNYKVISANDVIEFVRNGKPLPKKSILITIDDGYRNNYLVAFPILKLHKIPAIFFISTGFVSSRKSLWPDKIIYALNRTGKNNLELIFNGKIIKFGISSRTEKIEADKEIGRLILNMDKEDRQKIIESIVKQTGCDLDKDNEKFEDYALLSWEEIKEISKNGIYIGAHTHNHLSMGALPTERIKEEIALSKQIIEQNTGISPLVFAYPYGGENTFNPTTRKVLAENGFTCAFINIFGFNNFIPGFDPLELKRIGIENNIDFINFKAYITGVNDFFSNFKRKFLGFIRW